MKHQDTVDKHSSKNSSAYLTRLPLLHRNSGAIHIAQLGLMARRLVGA